MLDRTSFTGHLKDRKVKKNYPACFSMSLAYILSTDSKTVNLSIRENNSGFSLVDNSLKADNKLMRKQENFP